MVSIPACHAGDRGSIPSRGDLYRFLQNFFLHKFYLAVIFAESIDKICIGYHMSGEVISVLSLEGRYYNCHERAQRARDNYDIVTRVIKLISSSQSCDNLFITYLCFYQALNMEKNGTRSECVFH